MQGYNLMVTGIIWMEVEDVMNLSSVRKVQTGTIMMRKVIW